MLDKWCFLLGIAHHAALSSLEFYRVHTGCPSLLKRIKAVHPKYHIFGHIHEGYGRVDIDGVAYCNVSSMDKRYVIANDAYVIDLD